MNFHRHRSTGNERENKNNAKFNPSRAHISPSSPISA